MTPTAVQLVELILMKPVINARAVQEFLKVTYPAAQKAISLLEEAGILTEITGRKRDKAYAANEILRVLDETITPD